MPILTLFVLMRNAYITYAFLNDANLELRPLANLTTQIRVAYQRNISTIIIQHDGLDKLLD